MDKIEENIRGILAQLNNDTRTKRIMWKIYRPNNETIYFVARGKSKKRKKRKIIAEIHKQRTESGTYVIIYLDGYGLYWKYSMFKNLEHTIVGTSPEIIKSSYYINKPILNTLDDIAVMRSDSRTMTSKVVTGELDKQNAKWNLEKSTLLIKKDGVTSIGMKDFVVRRNVFKCMHNHHQLENVDAEVTVTNRIGKDRVIPFTAGYCKECKTYFIMESTYAHIRKFGIPNCRISDEKGYTQAITSNGMLLAKESILMQYGYTVSMEYDLMEITRHKILANLIDNSIMTKNEIISYLDFFISQHNNAKYQMAVGKWELDRDFIRDYKVGQYTKYGVGGIRR